MNSEETTELNEEDLQLLNAIKCIPGFENIDATEKGMDELDNKFKELEDTFKELEVDPSVLDKITLKSKVHDLNREVTVTFQAKDDETFKLLTRLAPFVELLPVLAKMDMLPPH